MPQYLFKGIIHPERAILSIGPFKPKTALHISSQKEIEIELNIVLNQISIWIHTSEQWDIYDLRNIARYFVNSICSVVSYLKGYSFDVEIRQVLCKELGIDYVFGVDVPCISKRHSDAEISLLFEKLLPKTSGEFGLFITRCLNDLNMALKNSEDTAFYCFRGIESLKQYCKYRYNLKTEAKQWEKVAELSGYEKSYTEQICKIAFPERHGDIISYSSKEREEILTKTWNVVSSFLEKV